MVHLRTLAVNGAYSGGQIPKVGEHIFAENRSASILFDSKNSRYSFSEIFISGIRT